jgi:type IV secretion system protein VirD4
VSIASAGTVLETALAAGAAYALVKRPWVIRPPSDGARMGTLADLKKAGLLDGQPGASILLGTFAGRDVRYSGDSHFFVNGPTRSGKGRGFVMTNLLEWRGSVIVLDVKQENWRKTGPTRAAMGQKLYLVAPGSPDSHCWNPLDFVRPWPSRATDLAALAASLLPSPEGVDPYWIDTARSLFAGMVGYVTESKTMEGRRTLRSVLRMFSVGDVGQPGEALFGVLKTILQNEPELPSFISDAFRQHIARELKQRGSFESHITTALAGLNNRLIAATTSCSDFDITQLRRTPFSIFIAAPVSDFSVAEPLIRLLIQQIHDVLLRTEPGEDEPHKVLFMLDEFYQFKRLPEIIYRAPLVAGFGFRIAIIAQNLSQIDERYGKTTREALLGNMDVKLFIAVGDDVTADSISRDFGKHYVERSGWNSGNGARIGGRSVSGRFESVPLMPPDVTKRLDDKKAMLLVRGHYGVILNKLNFYTDGRFRDLATAGDAFVSTLVAPKVQLTREWPLFMPRPMPADPDATWSEVPPLKGQTLNHGPRGSRGAGAGADGTGKKLDEPYDELEPDRLKISANASLAYEDDWRFQGVVEEAMQSAFDDPTATIAFNLRTRPAIYGALRGAHGLFGWDRQRRKAMAAVTELRHDVLSMRHAVKERQARLAAEKKKAAAQLITLDDVLLAPVAEAAVSSSELPDRDRMLDRSDGSAPPAPNANVSESDSEGSPIQARSDRSESSADLKTDMEESARLIEMAGAAKATLTSAAERTDSPQRKAELMRISEAFAKTRGALSDEDRRENTLGSPSLGKRARLKRTP